jgi:hypothetical protein
MPKFFLPFGEQLGTHDVERTYTAIRDFARSGWEVTPERIFLIAYTHDGRDYISQVGKPEPYTGEECIAIFRSNAYLVCTPNRGVLRGDPILVGLNEVRHVELFDDSPPAANLRVVTP